jgi:cytochrome c-type biogenesis protein CcmH/NrfG
MMARALKRSSSPRGLRFSSWVQLVGVLAIILVGVVAVGQGLAQQRPGLAPNEVDCRYRVRLIRDRVVALTLRSPRFRDGDPQDDVVLNLIRETQAACSADAASMQTLDRIEAQLRAHVQQNARESEVRRELLAL